MFEGLDCCIENVVHRVGLGYLYAACCVDLCLVLIRVGSSTITIVEENLSKISARKQDLDPLVRRELAS